MICSKHGKTAALLFTTPRVLVQEYWLRVFNLDLDLASVITLRRLTLLNTPVANLDPLIFRLQDPLECSTILNANSVQISCLEHTNNNSFYRKFMIEDAAVDVSLMQSPRMQMQDFSTKFVQLET